MTKKKSLILIFILLIFVLLSTYLGITLTKRNNTNEIYKENAKTDSSFSMFAIMIETEAGSGKYQQSTSNGWPGEGYIFNEQMSSCENGGELSWNEELGAVNLKTNTAEKCYVYFDKEPDIVYFADYIINNVYVEDGVNGLYYHDGQGSYTNANLEAGDNSYRYAGANPNNYVCFGTDTIPCPSDNIYRIIGVFDDKVKLIKNNSIGNYVWDADVIDFDNLSSISQKNSKYKVIKLKGILAAPNPIGSNDWPTSDLNYYINNNLYFNNIEDTWQNKIATISWKVGGLNTSNGAFSNAQTAYNYEVGANSSSTTYNAKIGLMYISDYYYGASPTYWIYPGYSSSETSYDYRIATGNNWMHLGSTEWTIIRHLEDSIYVFFVDSDGIAYITGVSDFGYDIRPCFYLNSNVTYVSGDGSQENPFRIE